MNPQLTMIAEDYLLAGEVTPEDARLLLAALTEEGAAAGQVHDDLAFAVHLARALDDDAETFVERVARRIRTATPARGQGWGWRSTLLAAAASLAAGLALGWLGANASHPLEQPQVVCSLAADATGVRMERDGVVLPAAAGQTLHDGDVISTSQPATIAYPDRSQVHLSAGTRLRILDGPAGMRLGLERGECSTDLATRTPGRGLQILTPLASVETTGASFLLGAEAERTRLMVRRGEVRFVAFDGGATSVVGAGGSAETFSPDTTPGWTALWPRNGLADWMPEYGTWRNQDGTMTGTAIAGGRARLLSVADYDDFELSCRVRLNNPPQQGEIQLSGYQWFVMIPASGDQWIDVTLIQHGSRITCQLNGASAEVHAGEPPPEPSRLLAFYLTGPGRIEITNARIRSLP